MKNQFKNKISLQLRVLLLTIITATLVVLLIESISNWRTISALENEVGGQTNTAAKQLTDKLKLYTVDQVPGVFRALIPPIRKVAPNILRIDVYTKKSGHLQLVDSTVMKERVLEDFEREALKSGKAKTYMLEPGPGKRRVITVRPIQFQDGHIGIVTLICSLKPFKQLLAIHSSTRNYALAATILLLVFTMTWMFQSSIYRNIRHLVQVILRFRQGETKVRANEKLPGEFGELSSHLNSMLQEISQFHDQLQSKVDEATQSLSQRNQELNVLNLQLHEMQKKLGQAERMSVVGQLTATFAHEIGSPLTAVSTHLQILEEEVLSDNLKKYVKTAYEQLNRVCGIVESLLKNTRMTIKRQTVDLVVILKAVIELMQPLARVKNVDVNLFTEKKLMLMQGDFDQLQQLFLNLFDNALDAINQQGDISIKAHCIDQPIKGLMISFADNGVGIAEDKIEHVFTPFFTTKEIGKGTGLGLAVCQDIVNQHQGTIDVKRESGQTVFIICFPVPERVMANINEIDEEFIKK